MRLTYRKYNHRVGSLNIKMGNTRTIRVVNSEKKKTTIIVFGTARFGGERSGFKYTWDTNTRKRV